MDIKPRQPRDIRQQRSSFQPSYYYAPARPVSQFAARPQSRPATPTVTKLQDFSTPSTQRQSRPTTVRPITQQQTPAQPTRPQPNYVAQQLAAPGPIETPKARRSVAPVFVMMAVILCSIGVGAKILHGHRTADAEPKARTEQTLGASTTKAETTEPITQAPPVVTNVDEMATAINAIITANKPINVGVGMVDLKTGQSYSYGVDAAFDAASTGKMVTAIDFLKQVELGKESLDKKLGESKAADLLKSMVQNSDNSAWQTLNSELTHSQLQSFGSSVGMTSYKATTNVMKPQDLASLEAQMYQGKILNDEHKKLLLSYMKDANKTEYLMSALPGGINVYHKAGWLADRSHDSAIVDNGTNPYVIVIYTKSADGTQEEQRVKIIHQIANASVAHFIGKETAAQLTNQ